MKIFVTGGSGFVGRPLLHYLRQQGHEVGALARSPEAIAAVRAAGATCTVGGSLDDIDRWQEQLAGYDVVIHAAAPIELWAPWARLQAQIVDASRQLLQAAERQGVRRFVYLSSESVWQDHLPLLDIDETLPPAAQPNSGYGRAKKLAEQALMQHRGRIERIILRPAFVWGPDCPALLQLVEQARRGQFAWVDGGRAAFTAVHLDNLLPAIAAACSRGRDGAVFALTDGIDYDVRGFFTPLLQQAGVAVPKLSLPGWLLRPVAGAGESVWRSLHLPGKPPLTRFELAFVAQPRRYRIDAARRELGYAPQPARPMPQARHAAPAHIRPA